MRSGISAVSAVDSIRVLHVDDEPSFAELAATFLERENERLSVETATNVSDGVDRLEAEKFDCIVSDYDMPDRNGIEFLEAVREEYPSLPFILFTGKGSEEIASDAISAGVTDYLQKETGTDQYAVLANRVENAVERARAETERRRQLDAIETAREGISILDESRRFIYVNEAYADLYGYEPEDLIGESWQLLYRDRDQRRIREEILPTVEENGHWHGESVGLRADGTTFYEDHVLSVTEDGELVCAVRDATERIERERELERASSRLEVLFEESPDMINVHDADGTITEVNQRFCSVLDQPESELVGKKVWEIDPTIDQDEFEESLAGIGVGDRFRTETEFELADGTILPVEVHVTRLDLEATDQFIVVSRDISERKDQEQRLEQVTERYRTLIEHGSDVISVIDEDGTITYQSPQCERILGYEPAELEGENAFEYVHPDDRDGAWDAFSRTLDREVTTAERIEYRFEHADGSWVWLESIGRNQTTSAVDGYVLSSREITERRKHERELERNNALLSTLVDTLPVGVLAEDASRNVLAINQRMIDLFGMEGSPEGIVGSNCEGMAESVRDLFVDPEGFLERIDDLIGNRERTDAETLELRDGRLFARSHRPIELPEGDGHLWVYEDVTDRKTRERRLEAVNETTHELMRAENREAVAEIGVAAASDILDLEANAIHLYDESASGLVPYATTDSITDLVGDPPTFTGGESIAWRVFQEGEPLAVDDVREDQDTYNPDTEVRSELYLPIDEFGILIAGSAIPNAFDQQDLVLGEILAGNVAGALEQIDRTEQVRSREQALARQNDRLEEFASVVSHDLRNPLNVAEGHLELAREDHDLDGGHLEKVERSHDRMYALIENLLELAHEGDQVTATEPLELAEYGRECWHNVATADATLEIATDERIHADPGRLEQLLENLYRNALEHGGDDVTVTVGDLEDGFYVEDDGPGIDPEDRPDVFDAGYTTSSDGIGFGLSIVERIVTAHDWEIRVLEGTDGGARFEITGVELQR